MFLFGGTAVLAVVHYYLWRRLVAAPRLSRNVRRAATAALAILGLSLPAALIGARALPFGVARWLVAVPYVWLGALFWLAVLLAATDLVRAAVVVYGWGQREAAPESTASSTTSCVERASRRPPTSPPPAGGGRDPASRSPASGRRDGGGHGRAADDWLLESGAPVDVARRLFLSRVAALGAPGIVVGLTGGGAVVAALEPKLVHLPVALARLPRALSGFSIVQITDLHLGVTLGGEFLAGVVARVNALAADLVAITGDLVDGSVARLAAEVAPLAQLRARHGVFFVTGNHEYYSGAEPWLEHLGAMGIRVLRNERVSIEVEGAGFDLVGIDDHSSRGMAAGHGPDLPSALAGRVEGRETVLLAHQPRCIAEAAAHDIGLVLSGHTHGGQIWPWNLVVGLAQPYVRGLHVHGARTQIYVSAGTGHWGPPLRVGTRAEITRVELRSSAS
ncbi:MAG: metallophosphoesterase [Candidatus Schekmanbacteria bacterium]|nr:metallophosphoesterase [Candidatus Schekmanbacteria bacterium]